MKKNKRLAKEYAAPILKSAGLESPPKKKAGKLKYAGLMIQNMQDVLVPKDNWRHRSSEMRCRTCMTFVPKESKHDASHCLGRCRRHAPTLGGWPVVFETDWCGDHKLDENKITPEGARHG